MVGDGETSGVAADETGHTSFEIGNLLPRNRPPSEPFRATSGIAAAVEGLLLEEESLAFEQCQKTEWKWKEPPRIGSFLPRLEFGYRTTPSI